MKQVRTAGGGSKGLLAELGSFALIALAVWLGWQVVRELTADRLPPALALRLSPASPRVLARAAEAEFAAERHGNAEELARLSLARAPFNARALRVVGLSEAKEGQSDRANDILTLAGNWSLRDDPAHAWLVEHRLSRGDYGSAFAHADTLARRRPDLHAQLFKLFTMAATLDQRALPPLVRLLAAKPPWRRPFLGSLYTNDKDMSLAATLAIMLQSTGEGAFTDTELEALNRNLLSKHYVSALSDVRERLRRPDPALTLVNGDFATPSALRPFEWKLFSAPGTIADILTDDLRPSETALRVEHDGRSSQSFVEQLILLPAGTYRLGGEMRTEAGEARARLNWTVACLQSREIIGTSQTATATAADTPGWRPFSVTFTVPEQNCAAQWVRLTPESGRRATSAAWYDRLSVTPVR